MIVLIDVGKVFDKIQSPFMVKTPNQTGSRRELSPSVKGHLHHHLSEHNTSWQNTTCLLVRVRKKTRMSTLTVSISVVLELCVRAASQEKEQGLAEGTGGTQTVHVLRRQQGWAQRPQGTYKHLLGPTASTAEVISVQKINPISRC